jgi:hypothetical protein
MPAIAPAASASPAMTFAIGFLLLCFEPSKQLGPVDRLIVVRHDL